MDLRHQSSAMCHHVGGIRTNLLRELELKTGIRTNLLQELELTSRERPKSALYLRLKIVKGELFEFCETPAGGKI